MLDFNPYKKEGYTRKIHYYWFMPLFTVFVALWMVFGFFVHIFAFMCHLTRKVFKRKGQGI